MRVPFETVHLYWFLIITLFIIASNAILIDDPFEYDIILN